MLNATVKVRYHDRHVHEQRHRLLDVEQLQHPLARLVCRGTVAIGFDQCVQGIAHLQDHLVECLHLCEQIGRVAATVVAVTVDREHEPVELGSGGAGIFGTRTGRIGPAVGTGAAVVGGGVMLTISSNRRQVEGRSASSLLLQAEEEQPCLDSKLSAVHVSHANLHAVCDAVGKHFRWLVRCQQPVAEPIGNVVHEMLFADGIDITVATVRYVIRTLDLMLKLAVGALHLIPVIELIWSREEEKEKITIKAAASGGKNVFHRRCNALEESKRNGAIYLPPC
uniref:Uncharacterized protein n=1 Tax=Anopheles coluzzii TaxID=1518534 RepID=A0A8W7Q2Y4_ANOCL